MRVPGPPTTLGAVLERSVGFLRPRVVGLMLSATVAAVAMSLSTIGWLQAHGISALTTAIVVGIAIGNSVYPRVASTAGTGVAFSKQTILRAGVILYGFRLTMHDISLIGIPGVIIDAVVLSSTFAIAYVLGTRIFGLDRRTAILIGAGSGICGAAAVMATEPIVRAKAEQVSVAIATVVLFGTAAIFLYPVIYVACGSAARLAVNAHAFGIYAGSTIHEVAQVFAAGRSISEGVANTAVITKMVRVMMLAPFLIGLSAWVGPDTGGHPVQKRRRVGIPWFAVGFLGTVALNSLVPIPRSIIATVTTLDTYLLAMAMAALGLTTHVSAIRAAGPKPLILGGLLFGWLVIGGGAINLLVTTALK